MDLYEELIADLKWNKSPKVNSQILLELLKSNSYQGTCFLGYRELAALAQCSHQTLYILLRQLRELGKIVVEKENARKKIIKLV